MRPALERLGGFLPTAIVLALPTVFIPGVTDEFILPRMAIAVGGACLGLALALLVSGGPGLGGMRWPLIGGAAAAVLALVFSVSWPVSIAGSYERYESLPVRLSYLALFAVPVWLLRDARSRDWVITAFVFGTGIASIKAMQQAAAHVPFRPDGDIGNAGLLGALIAMAIPLAVARGLRKDRYVFAWWLAVAALAGGLFVSTSRAGMLGALAGCVALAVLLIRNRLAAYMAGGAGVVVLVLALAVIVFGPLSSLNNDPASARLHLWPDAARMVMARPLTGWGEDATGLVFGRFLRGDYAQGVTFDRAHSGPLDIGATEGLLGLLALGWILFVLFRGVWRWRAHGSVVALAAACVAYTVWVFVNFDWVPATGAFWLLAGTAWSWIRDAETSKAPRASVAPRGPSAARSLGAVALALAAAWLAVMPVLAEVWSAQGRADLAVLADPLQARYHWELGLSLVMTGATERGVVELRRAADLGASEPQVYVDLGDAELKLGETAQARRDYARALVIDPFYSPAKQRLAATAYP